MLAANASMASPRAGQLPATLLRALLLLRR
jgi:hypothetical protein